MLPQRKHPVHMPFVEQHNMPVIIFLTVCVHGRQPLLASESVHAALRAVWLAAGTWRVGPYLIMPDHVHLFCTPAFSSAPLAAWVRFWKRHSARALGFDHGFWQRSFWDTQIRSFQDYEQKYEYVRHNTVRKQLVSNADDWPYQGMLTPLT